MKEKTKMILTLVTIAAVMAYTVFNFITGEISMSYFMIFAVILGIPFLNILNLLIQELKKK